MGEAVNGFLGNPSFQDIGSMNGLTYVNVTGKLSVDGKSTKAVIQFTVDQTGYVKASALEYNGEAKTQQDLLWLMNTMAHAQ